MFDSGRGLKWLLGQLFFQQRKASLDFLTVSGVNRSADVLFKTGKREHSRGAVRFMAVEESGFSRKIEGKRKGFFRLTQSGIQSGKKIGMFLGKTRLEHNIFSPAQGNKPFKRRNTSGQAKAGEKQGKPAFAAA